VADKGKGKEAIIGNTWAADENVKVSCRKLMVKKISGGEETLKITIMASNARRQAREGASPYFAHRWWSGMQAQTVWYTAGQSSAQTQTVRAGQADSPATPRNNDDHIPLNLDDRK
jgi:hypothetical protein